MNFEFSEEQQMLRDNARRYLSETMTFERLRAQIDSAMPFDTALWRQVGELGWTGAAVPEEFGGLGLGAMELCVLAEELGRVLAPLPFLQTAAIAVDLLRRTATPAGNALLERIASAETVISIAGLDADGPAARLEWRDGILSGSTGALAWAVQADHAIVYAGTAARPVLLLVDLAASGVQRRALPGIDPLVPHGALML